MSNEKKWVYKSNIGGSIVVKPTTFDNIYDSQGNLVMRTRIKPIKLHFVNSFLVINEELAKTYGIDVESLVKLVEGYNDFGKRYFLVQSPDFAASKEEIAKVEKAMEDKDNKSKIRVLQGDRKR